MYDSEVEEKEQKISQKELDFIVSFCEYVNDDKDAIPRQILSVDDICDMMSDKNGKYIKTYDNLICLIYKYLKNKRILWIISVHRL